MRNFLFIILFLPIFISNSAYSRAGDHDRSFGIHGISEVGFSRRDCLIVDSQPTDIVVRYWDYFMAGSGVCGEEENVVILVAKLNPRGRYDRSFGNHGRVELEADDYFRDLALTSQNEKMLVAHYGGILRLENNGQIDRSFGHGNWVSSTIAGRQIYIDRIAAQPDGKVVAVGAVDEPNPERTVNQLAVGRWNADGTVDRSFGNNGLVLTPLDPPEQNGGFTAVSILRDGKILVAGYQSETKNTLVRYQPNGTLDQSFGRRGIVTIDAVGYGPRLALDGAKILLTRTEVEGGSRNAFNVLRFQRNGNLDNSFGRSGMITTELEEDIFSMCHDVAVSASGEIITVGGGSLEYGAERQYLARYLRSGNLDPHFGNQGIVSDNLGTPRFFNTAHAVVIDSDGKIVVSGIERESERMDPEAIQSMIFKVVRYHDRDEADLQLTLSQPNSASRNRDLVATITVRNRGPEAAGNISFMSVLPLVPEQITPSQGSCARGRSQLQICTLGEIPTNSSATVTITMRPAEAGRLTTNASIQSSSARDSQPNNNSATATTTVR